MSFFRPPPRPDEDRADLPSEVAPLPVPAALSTVEGYQVYEAPPPSQALRRLRHVGWELLQTLVLAAVIFFAVRAMAQNFRVEGASMEPGLHDGQYLLVNKAVYFKINLDKLSRYIPFVEPGDQPQRFLFRAPHRGDVIVFRFPQDPSRDFIKRVVGVPGDRVRVDKGTVFVNGSPLAEPYIHDPGNYDFAEKVVPNGQYFVLGDNRGNSYDSHMWGFLPEDNIIGQAMVSYWPLDNFGRVGNHSIDLGFVSLPLP